MTDIDLNELRRLAEKATPGPWHAVTARPGGQHWGVTHSEYPDFPTIVKAEEGYDGYGSGTYKPDADYIAAANPAIILELLHRIEKAENALSRTLIEDEVFDYRPTEDDRREQQAQAQQDAS